MHAGSVSLWLSNNTTTFIIIVAVSSGVTIIGALLLFWRTFIVRWQRRARRKSLADADTQVRARPRTGCGCWGLLIRLLKANMDGRLWWRLHCAAHPRQTAEMLAVAGL